MDVEITWDWLLDRCEVPDDREDCWLWAKSIDTKGHPKAGRMIDGHAVMFAPHRSVYASFVGPIPAGHVVHHVCETKRCVNPAHLTAITRRQHYTEEHDSIRKAARVAAEKRASKTHCKHGHERTSENTYIWVDPKSGNPKRQCRKCREAIEARRA